MQTGLVAESDAEDSRTPRARMEAGDLYRVDDEIAGMHLRAIGLCEVFNATPTADHDGRRRVLEVLLRAMGPDAEIRAPFHCDFGSYLSIGARTFANFGLIALDVAPIVIGDDVQIGPNVQLLTATHPLDAGLRRAKWEAAEPIAIGDNVWLGGGVVVLPGVTIGQDTVVGAGTVVVRDLPDGVVAVGNPARIIRRLDGQFDGSPGTSWDGSTRSGERGMEPDAAASSVELSRASGGDATQEAGWLDE